MIDGILDSNIIADLLNDHAPAVTWIQSSNLLLAITPIVYMEIYEGARNKVEALKIVRFLKDFEIEHPFAADNLWSIDQFTNFHLSHGIEWTDTMIASVSVRLRVPLYTRNTRHFAVLPDLVTRKPY